MLVSTAPSTRRSPASARRTTRAFALCTPAAETNDDARQWLHTLDLATEELLAVGKMARSRVAGSVRDQLFTPDGTTDTDALDGALRRRRDPLHDALSLAAHPLWRSRTRPPSTSTLGAVPGPTLSDMSDAFPFYDDPFDSDEPTAAERAEALRQFRADAGRWPGIGDDLDRGRLAEIDAVDAEPPPGVGKSCVH